MPEQNTRELTVLVADNATVDDLRTMLGDSRLELAYASRIGDTGLGWLRDLLTSQPLGAPHHDDRPGVLLDQWTEGRAFGPQLEVDWWRDGRIYHLRALLEQGDPPDGVDWYAPSAKPLNASDDVRYILLHGTQDKKSSRERPTWSEAKVPRHLAHPHKPKDGQPLPERLALVGQDYERDSVVVLTRLIGVAPVEAVQREESEQ